MAEAELLPQEGMTDRWPDFNRIVTEDDEPVDNLFSEKQQRLLTESLNSSWDPGRQFLAAADVAIFYAPGRSPVVPDTFVSLDVRAADDLWEKRNRSYFVSEFGKPPDIAVEIVSNTKGGETGRKLSYYAQAGVRYYIIFDPQCLVQGDALRVYELAGTRYKPRFGRLLTRAGLGVTLWEGVFEGKRDTWLRWLDYEGNIIPTGCERAETERERAEHAERQVARLAAKLRELGISPE